MQSEMAAGICKTSCDEQAKLQIRVRVQYQGYFWQIATG